MRLAWLTDIHLDFLQPEEIRALSLQLSRLSADALLVTGDLSTAPRLARDLGLFVSELKCPCYFVLGNHDYYGSSIGPVREGMRALRKLDRRIAYLPDLGSVRLSERTALVGVDGWADGRLGDGLHTDVLFNDHFLIADLKHKNRAQLLEKCAALGEREGAHLSRLVGEALGAAPEVVVATHIPPFAEACQFEGRPTGPKFLPWMTCHAAGNALRKAALSHQSRQLLVLSGHSHHAAEAQITNNLRARVGAATYGQPEVVEILEL